MGLHCCAAAAATLWTRLRSLGVGPVAAFGLAGPLAVTAQGLQRVGDTSTHCSTPVRPLLQFASPSHYPGMLEEDADEKLQKVQVTAGLDMTPRSTHGRA